MKNQYEFHGCENRQEYLEMLAEDYNIPLEIVQITANLLGPEEDFDGLVATLQDYGLGY